LASGLSAPVRRDDALMKNTKTKMTRRRKNNTRSVRRLPIPHPPPTVQGYRVKQTLGFYSTSALVKGSVTRAQLLDSVLVASTTTQFCRLFQSIVIRKVRIWSITSTSTNPIGNSLEVDLQWEATRGPAIAVSAVQMGIEPGCWETVPPPDSLASFWSQTGSDESEVLAYISCPASSIFHITFEAYLNAGTFAAITSAGSGLTVGRIYYRISTGGGGGNLAAIDMLTY
jgi:hypothetical protein